jgi:hypothetical protein
VRDSKNKAVGDADMADDLFPKAVDRAVRLYEQAIRRPATRTRQMIEDHGEVEALSRLMINPNLQQGFKVLRDQHQLDKTFEAVVVRFQHLFDDTAVESAQWRLDHPYDLL